VANGEKNILKITWQQIISAVIVMVFVGVLGWLGGVLKTSVDELDELSEWKVEVQTLIENDIAHTFENIDEDIKSNTSGMGTLTGDVKRLEILINRLEVLVNKLDN